MASCVALDLRRSSLGLCGFLSFPWSHFVFVCVGGFGSGVVWA